MFERRGRHVFVTAEGAAIADAVRGGFDNIAHTIERLQRERNGRTLTLACSFDVGTAWLMPRYADLRERFAEADIRIVTTNATAYAEFDKPDIDLSIRFGEGKWANYQSVQLYRECAYPGASLSYLERYPELRALDSPDELPAHRLLDADNGRSPALTWRRWLHEFGVASASASVARFPSHVMLTQAVLRGEGIALFWEGIHDDLLAGGGIVRLGKMSVETDAGHYLVARDLARDPVSELVDFFLESRVRTPSIAAI